MTDTPLPLEHQRIGPDLVEAWRGKGKSVAISRHTLTRNLRFVQNNTSGAVTRGGLRLDESDIVALLADLDGA